MTVSSGLAFTPVKTTPSYNASKAAIHMLSESIRLQLADTTVKVVELEPPNVRTALLPGQETSESPRAWLDSGLRQTTCGRSSLYP